MLKIKSIQVKHYGTPSLLIYVPHWLENPKYFLSKLVTFKIIFVKISIDIIKYMLIFPQACRGYKTDRGTTVSFQQTDNPTEEISQSIYTIPLMADFLFFYATFQGNRIHS